jgi:Zn-dependent protease with chaperone function
MAIGTAIYFDGLTSARQPVTVETTPEGLLIRQPDGILVDGWRYGELRAMPAPEHVMRLGRIGHPVLARLEIRDAALAQEIDEQSDELDRSGMTERRLRKRVIGWVLAATVSLVLVAIYGVPALADRIAPLIPLSVEHRLGLAVDAQIRTMLDTREAGAAFECGTAEGERAGRAALDKLLGRLEQSAALPIPLKVAVVRRPEANAVALPGGHIYVFRGLVQGAQNPDELAGVIAHEIGHVAHRDGTRSVLQAAGLSFLFGILLGDFTGGGVVVIAAKTVMQSAYSREVETAADNYGVRLMAGIGGDVRAFAAILERIAGAIEPGVKILLDHPETKQRITTINAAAGTLPSERRPLLTAPEWAALKRICG